jgi:CheY-like chemotaxis protein/anti-sigma regulatory factor (Ser/Thr protein kinase)
MGSMTETNILRSLEIVSEAMNKARDVEHIIDDVLDAVFGIFDCDRIWLFHPCDPNTATIKVLAEKNKPEYPGAFTTGEEIPINAAASETIRKALVAGSPVVFGPGSGNKIDDVTARFSVLSQMMMAIHPKSGKPWMFGMHQCAFPRVWTEDDQLLFKEISYRVVEGLNNLILLKETALNASEPVKDPGIEAGKYVQLSICDTGTGIDPQIRDKIFDPYFTTKETGKGTGMGLAVCHGIVRNYGGVISIDSEPGKGTAVHVFLPIIDADAVSENAEAEPIPGGNERILFIDDEEILTSLNKAMLEELGYNVTASCNSREALRIYQQQPDQFDLVITDQTMPGLTGAELAAQMLQIRPDLPIILCTGYSSIISRDEARSMGIRSFAAKPLGRKEMASLIRESLIALP